MTTVWADLAQDAATGRHLDAATQRERETVVLTAMAIGLLQSHSARRLGICGRTFRRYQVAAMTRLGAVSPTHAVALAVADGEVDSSRLCSLTLPAWPREPKRSLRAGETP
jgi:DNA-binding NarL/FixJ family response regulator